MHIWLSLSQLAFVGVQPKNSELNCDSAIVEYVGRPGVVDFAAVVLYASKTIIFSEQFPEFRGNP